MESTVSTVHSETLATTSFIQTFLLSSTYVRYKLAKTRRMPKLQVVFRKRATEYRALLRKITFDDKASYGSRHLYGLVE